MRTIHLSDQEQQFLLELLQREIPNLREEILHTDDYEYRNFLKERERFVNDLVHHLSEESTA
jgi:hypothetical protein